MDPAKLADARGARAVLVTPPEAKAMTAGGSGTTFKLYADLCRARHKSA